MVTHTHLRVVQNAKNQIVSEDRSEHRDDDIYRYLSTYDYGDIVLNADGSVNVAETDYALGSAVQVDTQQWKDGGGWPTQRTVNAYHWYEGAVADQIKFDGNINDGNPATWDTTYTYDVLGGQAQLEAAFIQDGQPRTVAWTLDMLGQAIRRSEGGGSSQEIWHRLSGRQMGYVAHSVNNDVGYTQSNSNRIYGADPSAHADFDLAFNHITTYEQGSMGGAYIARAGDTLQSIAAGMWGDASLWWKIAEANGLSGQSALSEGQSLLIPVGVQRNENNATTFQPYDPLEVLGNTSPTSPKPKDGGGCGGFGQVLLVIIAVVVTIWTAGAAAPVFAGLGAVGGAVATGVVAGAAGSIASQAVGVATGIQEKFSWNAVALSAIGGGVSAGVSAAATALSGSASALGSSLLNNSIVQAVTSNIITQGIGVATGLQDKFSWAGVAAAGVSAGVGKFVGDKLGATSLLSDTSARNIFANALTGGARAIAAGATRSLIEGSDFGDNVMAALPDVIGQTIGEAIAGDMALRRESRAAARGTLEEAANYRGLQGDARTAFLRTHESQIDGMARGIREMRLSDDPEALNNYVFDSFSDLAGATQEERSAAIALSYGDNIDVQSGAAVVERQESGANTASSASPSDIVEAAEVVVTGRRIAARPGRPALGLFLADELSIRAGNIAISVGERIDASIDRVPGLRLALAALDVGLMVAGGPVRAALGAVVGEFSEALVNQLVDRFESVGYRPEQAVAGGVGAPALLALATGGIGALRAVVRGGASLFRTVFANRGCFVAGTLVHTRTGLKPIEEIKVGDFVLSQPEVTGERGWRRVVDVFCFEDKPIWEIGFATSSGVMGAFRATPNHPFWVKEAGWTGAEYLEKDQILELADGTEAWVTNARATGSRARVYNFEVEGWHTYYVGEAGVWVHNADCDGREHGSYTNYHESGRTYSGKGGRLRSQVSGSREADRNNDPHVATDWTRAESERDAFIQESRRMDANGGVSSPDNYNRIESPGRRYRIEAGEIDD